MSSTERRRRAKRFKTLCAACQGRKARFRYRRGVRADRDHTLCFECYRGELNRARARRITGQAVSPPVSPFSAWEVASSRQPLDARQVVHRQRMLDHLQRVSAAAS